MNNACPFSSIYLIDQCAQYKENDSPLMAGVKLVTLIIGMIIGNFLCGIKKNKNETEIWCNVGFFPGTFRIYNTHPVTCGKV